MGPNRPGGGGPMGTIERPRPALALAKCVWGWQRHLECTSDYTLNKIQKNKLRLGKIELVSRKLDSKSMRILPLVCLGNKS